MNSPTKLKIFLAGILIFTCCMILQYLIEIHLLQQSHSKDVKYILYWTKMFDVADFYLGSGSEIFKDCPVSNCLATNNKSLLPVDKYHALMFHGLEYNEQNHGVPVKRSPNQVYIFFNMEAPLYTHAQINKNFYNWTITYRHDSDVPHPYGFVTKDSRKDYQVPTVEEINRRPKKIAWFVSNCNSFSEREVLYRKINEHIPVDVYGLCGNLTCSKENENLCYDMLEKNYKFYLSFENAICKDYVTEKLFNILKRNVVPIVYGGADYDKIVPMKCVIDTMKFNTVNELINSVKRLDKNTEEYIKYLDWKKHYKVHIPQKETLCRLCAKLNEPVHHKIYEDISLWWNGDDKVGEMCKSPLPEILNT